MLRYRFCAARLVASVDGTERLWGTRDGKPKQVLKLRPARGLLRQVIFSPEGRHLVTVNGNGSVYILRVAAPRAD